MNRLLPQLYRWQGGPESDGSGGGNGDGYGGNVVVEAVGGCEGSGGGGVIVGFVAVLPTYIAHVRVEWAEAEQERVVGHKEGEAVRGEERLGHTPRDGRPLLVRGTASELVHQDQRAFS